MSTASPGLINQSSGSDVEALGQAITSLRLAQELLDRAGALILGSHVETVIDMANRWADAHEHS